MTLRVGESVSVFDPRLFVDDVRTPLTVTMRPATVVRVYRSRGDLLADVRFEDRISRGHFVDGILRRNPR